MHMTMHIVFCDCADLCNMPHIVVAGGGPAGCCTAMLAAKAPHTKVTLLERRSLEALLAARDSRRSYPMVLNKRSTGLFKRLNLDLPSARVPHQGTIMLPSNALRSVGGVSMLTMKHTCILTGRFPSWRMTCKHALALQRHACIVSCVCVVACNILAHLYHSNACVLAAPEDKRLISRVQVGMELLCEAAKVHNIEIYMDARPDHVDFTNRTLSVASSHGDAHPEVSADLLQCMHWQPSPAADQKAANKLQATIAFDLLIGADGAKSQV